MFQPNPVTLVVRAKHETVPQDHCKERLTKIKFDDASVRATFWPEGKYQQGGKLPLVIGFRADAVHRVQRRWWSVEDLGPAESERVEPGHPRVARVNFHGQEFTKGYVDPHFKRLAAGGKPSDVDPQSQSLYDAFVANETIQFYVNLGTLEDAVDGSKGGDYFASLLVQLRYRQFDK